MTVVPFPTGRPAEPSPARILLITKHPFVPVHDGTSTIISLWHECLAGLGLAVDILSFDYVHARWSDEARAILARRGAVLHIVPAYGRRACRRRLASLAFAALRGHRFAPEWLRTDRDATASLDAVFARPYALIAVHGVDAVHLAGPDRLRAHQAAKLLDIHDHIPDRTLALQRTLLRLARWQGPAFLRRVARSDLLQAVAWPAPRLLARAERRMAATCDRILCASDSERERLRADGIDAARLLPIRWPLLAPPRDEAAATPRFDVGFLGSGALFNIEGLLFFCRRVWPLVRAARPTATLLVAGHAGAILSPGHAGAILSPGHAGAILSPGHAGITVTGWLDDPASFYRDVRVVAVPLLSGTGVSVKTMQAAAHGAAIVSTRAGLRGLGLRDRVEILAADTPRDFAAALLTLLDNPALAASLGRAARDVMIRAHHPTAFSRFLHGLVTPLLPPGAASLRRSPIPA